MQKTTRVLVFLASPEETAKQVMKLPFENSQFSAKDKPSNLKICLSQMYNSMNLGKSSQLGKHGFGSLQKPT